MEGYITDQEIHPDLLEKIYNNKEFESLEKNVSVLMNKLDTMKEDMVIENKGNVTKNDVLEGKTFLNENNKLETGSIETIDGKIFDIDLDSKNIDTGYYKNSKIKGLNNYSEDQMKDIIGKYIKNKGNIRETFVNNLIKEIPKNTIENIINKNSDIFTKQNIIIGEQLLVDTNILEVNNLEFKPSKIIAYGNYHSKTFINNNTQNVNYLMYDSDTKILFETERYKDMGWVKEMETTFTNNGFKVYLNRHYGSSINIKYIVFG